MGSPVFTAPALNADTLYVGTYVGLIVALDAATGAERWRMEADGPVVAAPALAHNTLYGVLSEDERGMPQDYRWTFTVVTADVAGMVPPEPVGALAPPAEGGVPGQLPGMPTPNDGTRIFLPLLRR